MAAAREYELVLLLDPGLDAPARDAVANEAKGQIEAAGTLKHENTWGLRKLAYEIGQRTEADYRWFRFEAPAQLLEQLDHNLKIADGVLRFRVFKVDADTPTAPPPGTAAPGPGASRDRPAEAGDGETPVPGDRVVEEPTETPVPAVPAAEPEAPVSPPAEPVSPAAEPEAPVSPPAEGDEPAAPSA